MPRFLNLISPSGKDEYVDISEFNKNPNAYGKYKIRMVDDSTGDNYDIPATKFGYAQQRGLRAWNMEKQTTKRKQVQNPAFQTPMPNGNLPADWGNAEMVNPKGFDAFGTNVPTTKTQQDAKDFVQGFDDAIKGRKTDGTDAWRDTMQRMANMNVQSAQKQFEDQIDYAKATGKPLTDDFLVQNLRNEENGFSMNKFGIAPTVARDKNGKPILDQKGDPVKGWTTDDVRASVERQTDIAARQRELGLHEKTTDEKLADLYKQRNELLKRIKKPDPANMNKMQFGMFGGEDMNTQLTLIEIDKQIKSLEAIRDKDELAWNGFFRGFENTAGNLRSWDFGLSDLALMGKMEEIKGKIDKGQQLTADEQELATSKMGADAAAALEDETMGNTYRWAKIGGESLPFMADFMLTGGYRGIAVKFAREASKLATKTLARNVLRNTGTLIGDVVGAYGMALTTQAGKTTADIIRRHQGSLTVDENGNFKFEGGESMPSAIAHGLNAAAIENYTEKFGEHLNFAKAFGKYGTEGMTQFFQNLSNKGWAKTMNAVAKRGGINGYIPEVIEEEIGLPLNALITGDNSWSDVLDVKQQADILGGMAISIGAMGALGLGVHLGKKGTTRLAARHYESKLNDADFNAAMAFDHGKWLDLKDVIDNTENKYMPSVQDRIIKSPALTPEQKIAANKYINTLLTYRGFNLGLMANMNNAEHEQQPARTVITPTQIDGKTSYAITYYNENGEEIGTAPQVFNTLENAEMYKQMLDEKRNDTKLQDLYSSIYIKDRDGSMRQSLDQQLQTVGLSLNDISRILSKSPFRRTDKEIQALDIMQNIANGMVYPPNEVHEEKDAQDGADLAEGTPVGDQATIDVVNEREANAISQWNQVADPDLQSSIKDLYEQGKTSNDIFDWLVANEYSDEVIAAFAELCNSGAQKDKFIEVTGQKIEEQVSQKVQQVTFAGTLNGTKNPTIIQVQDQTGVPMYIVSGTISVDEQGTLTSDGLIILRDENGNFIQRPDTNGLTLVGTQNAEDYRNQLLTQTQEAVTAQIQSTEYKAPEYNDSDVESAAPEAPQGNGLTVQQTTEQPAATSETQQQEQQQEQEPPIPLDENNNPIYHKAPIEATINDIYKDLEDEDARQFVQNNIDESSKEYEKISKKKPKIGTNKDAYLKAKEAWQQQVDEAKQKLDYWTSVKDYIQQQTHTTPEEIKAAQDELSGTTARLEYARQTPEGATSPEQIAGEFVKNAKIQPEDFYRETGLTATDARKQYPGMLSNNGATIARLAEQLVQYDNDNYGGMFFKGDDMEARNYIIEALKNASSRKSLGRNMTAEEQEYARVREQQREDFYQEAYGMSYSDYLAFEEQEMPNIWRRISNFAPEQYDQMVAEYYESLPEDYFTPQNEQQNGTEGQQDNGLADSTTVLPQPPTDNEAGSGQREDPAAETGNGGEGNNKNEEVPGGTQGVGQQEDETAAAIKKDIEDFISKSTHDVQITNYDEKEFEVQISVDGKPSNIVITPPMELGESMHAEYRPTEGGYQELGDLLDEYNEGLEPKEQGFDGEHLAAIFSSVDAAIDFEKWLNDKETLATEQREEEPATVTDLPAPPEKLMTAAQELLAAIESNDKQAIDNAKANVEKIINNLSHSDVSRFAYDKNNLVKQQNSEARKEAYKFVCKVAKKRADTLIQQLNERINESYPGVRVEYNANGFWLNTTPDSKYKQIVKALDNDRRWLTETGLDASVISPINNDTFDKWVKSIGDRLSEQEEPIKEKTWDEMDENEKMDYVFSQPLLTEEQIKNAQTKEVYKANALAFIKGQKSMVTRLSYYITYKNVKHSTGSSPANNEAGNTSQLDETNSGGGKGRRAERKHSGLGDSRLDTEGSGQTNPNQSGEQLLRSEDGKGRPSDDSGKEGDKQVPGNEQPVGRPDTGSDGSTGSGIDNGNGHNVSQQGGKGRSRKNTDTNRRGTDKANRDGATGNTQLNSENIDSQLQSEIDEFKNLLADYRNIKNKKNGNINSSIIPGVTINSEKIEAWGRLIYQGAKVGYLLLRKGHTSLSEWSRIMKDMLTPAMHDIEITDAEIDEFINEMWHCNLPIGDEVHTISEWSRIIQKNKLKEAVRLTLEEKKKKQLDAEPIKVKIADKNNIAETLPYLLPLQQDDVYKAEMQFFDESHNDYDHAYGKGYMFTNGTGTGKTYTGLGIVKRFIKQGKGRVLILTPSSTKVKDWVLDAANLNIKAHNLEEWAKAHKTTATTSKAEGVVVTTYANFRQNQALLEDEFDLVIYDESHRLLENKKGGETEGSKQHYMLTNKDEQWAFSRLQTVNQTYQEIQKTRKQYDSEYDKEKEKFQDEADAKFYLPMLTEHISKHEGYPNLKAIKEKYDSLVKKYNNEVKPQLEKQAKESVKKTKVVFLSATPFNTKENLGYAEGYIFQYPQTEGRIGRRSQFYLTNFGSAYRWRNNRLESRTTNPEAVAAQEVAFSDYLQNQLGTMSGRVIDSEYDYSRDFPTVTFEKADELNTAFEEIKKMEGVINKAFYEVMTNYQYTSVLFEAMKTSCILPRIREHINAGRKVVLFHRRMESARPITPPFQEILNKARVLLDGISRSKEKNEAKAAIADYEQRFAHMLEWEKTLDLRVPRVQILEEFGDDSVLFFSGKETTKQKNAAVEEFNRDSSPKKIIVIQEASGKEGISLHDVTGENQRVLISLAMPQSPITALQIEGRIYRIGNKSNAIFEYPLLGLDEELITWGQRFNAQVGTTENLALGSKARNLRESFARAVIEHSGDVPLDTQGTGGKEMDEAINQDQTDPFDKSILDFYGNAKTSGRRDNREGKDYYPTPEPLGFMMVKWANLSEGESVLEPSAGHGAIARYVPASNQLTSVEPSTALFGRLQVLAGGIGRKFENDIFENYNIINKHDVVLMNPPFGTAGRLAIDHVAKAFKHLSEGGRIVAIIPRGSADAKFDKWIQTEKTAALVGEIQLPNITFQNAGTQVACRVVVIDKISNEQMRNEALGNATQIELPNNYDKIEDFFEDLRGITMPARTIDQKTKNDKKIMPIIKELKDEYGNDFSVEFTPTGVIISGVGFDYLNMKGDMLKSLVAAQYARANKIIPRTPSRLTRVITAYETIKKMALKLADMSEEEMENYVRQNINDNTSVSSLSDQFVYEVKKNTRTGQDMHVVSKNKGVNLTDEEYSKAREIAKNNGGYWSRFAGGFIFPSELAAKSFLNGGNTPSADSSQQDNNRLGYSSNTNNVNNSRIVPEDVDKDVSLQIENGFDSAIENLNLTEEEKAELDKHISDYSNKSTIELEDIFYINNSRLGLRNEKKNNLSEMLWRRGSTVSPSAENVGGNIRNEKSGAESPTTANGEYSTVVSRRDGEAEGENTARGNEVQGQYNGPRDIRNSGSDRLLLHEGRRIEEKVLSKTSGTKLSSNQRRLLAAQYAISRELVYRDIRLAALKQSLGLEEGKQTSLDEIAAVFEKTNTDKEVKALFDKILAINKRLGTSVDIQASQEDGASGEAGTVRDVHYYLDGFTRTSAGKINIPVVIAHELLHQGTIGAINLVRKGKAEGVLTKEQIDAVNTIIDIYNKVKANPERLSESKRGLANPYEFAAQMVDPRQRRALSMSPLQRVIAAANELRAQGNNSLWERIKNALKTLFGMSDLKKMDNAINTLLDTFSETVHDISMNDVDQSGWGYTSTQLFDKYPTWLSGQTTGTGQHTTQITSTVNTYKKIGEWMKSQGMKGASVLDASSGLGKGTEALRDMGFNVEDVEPYPSETRTKPTYLKYEDIKGKYDVVISNAVLNVIPDDWRADVLKNMADKVKPGGKMIINVRDAKEMERQKQKIELDSPSEILVTDKAGNIRAYQKGFTQKELADWIQSELGEGWTIETAKPSNSGISGRAVVVTRNTETPLRYRKVTDSMQKQKMSEDEKLRMTNAATSLAESINTPIKVISAEEAPEGAKNSKGYYDTHTGEVTIVLDNNTSSIDVQRTVAHEVIGHKGLRGLLGTQNYYKIMNAVYDNLPEEEKQKINEATRRNGWQMYTAMDEYLAEQAENMVWDAKSASLWQNVKHYLAEALRTLGFIIKPNLKDARYWLWLSKNQLKRGDVMSNIKRNALLAKLEKLREISISKTEFVDENDNEIDEILYRKKVRLQTDPDVSFNLGEYLQGAILWFIKQGNNINTAIKEAFYDYAYSLKKLQEQMEKDLGGKIMDNMNFVLGENHISSIVKERIERFETKQVAELQEMIRDIFGKGRIATNTCETYLYLKSGLERNRVLFMRDWFNAEAKRKIEKEGQLSPEAQSIYENIAQGIWQDFDDGNIDEKERDKQLKSALAEAQMEYLNNVYDGFISLRNDLADQQATDSITLSEMYRQLDEYINQYNDFNADKEDKSGLSAFDENKVEGEYSDKRAIEIVESLEHEIGDRREKLWDKVQALTQFAIDYEYKRGMISKDTYNKCKKMFRWYIPLRGISENTMEDLYAYLGGKNDNNTALKHAKGRWTKAKTPLATAINMAERSIDAAERNYNAQRLYRAANELQRRNPDKVPYVAAMHCWYKLDKNTGEYNLQVPNITDDMSPEQIQDVTRRFEDDMKLAERNGEAIKKTNKAQHVAPFSVKHHANDHIVYVMFNGERRMIIFNGSPRPARVMRREMNPEVNWADAVIRKMSAFATTYNPSFTVSNFARDTESALNNVLINENAKYIGNFMLNQAKIIGDPVVGLFDVLNWNADNNSYVAAFIKYKKNEPPKSYNEKMFYEFMENGGSTGFNTLKSIEDIDKMLNRGRTVSAVMNKPIDVAAQYIGYANELLENANRYAAYLTSREAGRSVLRSVHDAKEVSINFNRRGAAGRTVRYAENGWDVTIGSIAYVFKHTHMFFNAAIQAFGRWLKNHINHPIRATFLDIIVPGTIGFCMSIINKMLLALGGDDDDEYANLPYYTRRNNLCIWNPFTHNWFILPIAQELSAFYGIGDIAAAYTLDKRLQTGRGMHTEILLQLQRLIPFDYVDPKGSVEDNAGIIVLETLGGDLTSTFIDIALNRTWSGGEIRKENEWNKNDPEYKKCYKNTNKMFVEISKWVNSIGNESSGVIKGKFDTALTNPANLEYLFNSYFGGTFKDYSNFVDLATNGFSINKTPILRRFFLTPDEKTKYSRSRLKWNIYKEDAQRYEDDLDALSKSKEKGDIILYSKYLGTEYNRPAGYRRMVAFKYYNNIIKRISRAMANAQNDDERQYYETMINEMKREAVNTMDNIE